MRIPYALASILPVLALSACCTHETFVLEEITRVSRLENVTSTGLPEGSPAPDGDGRLFDLDHDGRPTRFGDAPSIRISLYDLNTRIDFDPGPITKAAKALDVDLRQAGA